LRGLIKKGELILLSFLFNFIQREYVCFNFENQFVAAFVPLAASLISDATAAGCDT
jgi:hypothetical protein